MRISVIMPIRDPGPHLEDAVGSVLQQTYPDLELIVKDGLSRDGSSEVLERWVSDPRLKWVRSPDRGLGDAVNEALTHVSGRIVNWLGGDDLLLPGSLARVAEAFQEEPARQWLYGSYQIIDAGSDLKRAVQVQSLSRRRLLSANFIACQAAFVRLEALIEVGRVSPRLRFGMDYDLWLRLAQRYEPIVLPDMLGAFRYHRGGLTARHPLASEWEGMRVALSHCHGPVERISILPHRLRRLMVAAARRLQGV